MGSQANLLAKRILIVILIGKTCIFAVCLTIFGINSMSSIKSLDAYGLWGGSHGYRDV